MHCFRHIQKTVVRGNFDHTSECIDFAGFFFEEGKKSLQCGLNYSLMLRNSQITV
jgi:hypothetical protein